MKFWIVLLTLSFTVLLTATPFSDSRSGLSLEIPAGFTLHQDESNDDSWWYEFHDSAHNTLTIEIDYSNEQRSLPELFHTMLTSEEEDGEDSKDLVFEGLEFKNQKFDDLDVTKCKIRVLAHEGQIVEPISFYDCLFVNKGYGFCISLVKQEDDRRTSPQETEELMNTLLKSIQFTTLGG